MPTTSVQSHKLISWKRWRSSRHWPCMGILLRSCLATGPMWSPHFNSSRNLTSVLSPRWTESQLEHGERWLQPNHQNAWRNQNWIKIRNLCDLININAIWSINAICMRYLCVFMDIPFFCFMVSSNRWRSGYIDGAQMSGRAQSGEESKLKSVVSL